MKKTFRNFFQEIRLETNFQTEIRTLAKFLNGVAEQKEQLEIATNVNHQLQLENKKLANENDYLSKLNEINTAQLGYYTKKYHSWQDDYENY